MPQHSTFDHDLIDLIPRLRGRARHLTRNMAEADDLVQDTVERVLAKRALYTEGTNFSAWAFSIMRNRFIDLQRTKTRRGVHYDITDVSDVPRVQPGQEIAGHLGDVEKAINQLSPEQQVILRTVVVEGHSYEAVANRLNVAVGTVRSRLSRARSALQAQFSGNGDTSHATI